MPFLGIKTINKELLGVKNKKFGQNDSFEILKYMAYFHDDSKLACRLVNEAKHITIGDTLLMRAYDNTRGWFIGESKEAKQNAIDIYNAVRSWFGPA